MLGAALRQIIPKIVGQNITNWFELIKPLVEFKWEVICFKNIKTINELAEESQITWDLVDLDGTFKRKEQKDL